MAIEVWWGSGSTPAWRVLLGLAVKGVPREDHLLSFSAGDTRTPEFLALNPRGRVPTIRDGGYVLNESLAILAWLDRKVPDPPLFGQTPEEHGQVWRWCLEYENHGSKAFDAVVRPIVFGRSAAEAEAVRAAIPGLHDELRRLEVALEGTGFLVGERLSAADLVWFCGLSWCVRAASRPAAQAFELGVLPLAERYPRALALARRIEALPDYDTTFPPHWSEGDAPSPSRLY
jgi:glutathione S-transferase